MAFIKYLLVRVLKRGEGELVPLGAAQVQPLRVAAVAMGRLTITNPGSIAMKSLPLLAVVLVASLGACSIKEERVVQQPAPAATVVATPAAPGTGVYTDPAPATATTTVYTR